MLFTHEKILKSIYNKFLSSQKFLLCPFQSHLPLRGNHCFELCHHTNRNISKINTNTFWIMWITYNWILFQFMFTIKLTSGSSISDNCELIFLKMEWKHKLLGARACWNWKKPYAEKASGQYCVCTEAAIYLQQHIIILFVFFCLYGISFGFYSCTGVRSIKYSGQGVSLYIFK